MKLIVAVVRPERLDAVQAALADAKVFRLTVSDVQGLAPDAQGSAAAAAYAGGAAAATPTLKAERRVKLEVAVNEAFVEPTVHALVGAGRLDSGQPGDGSVFVLPLEDAIRIRTGERGPDAI